MDKKVLDTSVAIQGRPVEECPMETCKHHPTMNGDGKCGCIAGEWGMFEQGGKNNA
jgi:hypothetical protein